MNGRYSGPSHLKGTHTCDVLSAYDKVDRLMVALKVADPDMERPPHSARDEIKILTLLGGKSAPQGIVPLLNHFFQLHEHTLVFPLYDTTLTQYLRRRATVKKPNLYAIDDEYAKTRYKSKLDLKTGKSIVKGLAGGLSFLHSKGVIHRDIKPDNIMFEGKDPEPIIIDFGISYLKPDNFGKEPPEKKVTDVATSVYKAPELVFGITDYSEGVDIWALGIVMTMIFSENCEPFFSDEDVVDLRLIGMIIQTFGVPTSETWPDAEKSRTFKHLNLQPSEPTPTERILPRADEQIRSIFEKMMVFQSSKRIPASKIHETLSQSLAT